MAADTQTFAYHYAGFIRHIRLATATFIGISVLGAVITLSLTDIYRSTATILIEEAEIPPELIRTTVTSYATRQVSSLEKRIMTPTRLSEIIEKFDLFAEERRDTPVELLTGEVMRNINMQFVQAEAMTPQGVPRSFVVAFNVSYEDPSPETARRVTEELASLYLEENIQARTEQTAQTTQFLDQEVAVLDQQVRSLDSQLAKFKEDNAGSLPSLSMLNLNMMNRVDAQLLEVDRQLHSIEENRIAIAAQLATIEPTAPMRLADGQIVLAPADQLKGLQTQLAVLVGRYSENHPDVVQTRNDIKALKDRFNLETDIPQLDSTLVASRADLAIAREKYSEDHPDVQRQKRIVAELEAQLAEAQQKTRDGMVEADNPTYVQLQSQVNALDSNRQALLAQRDKLLEDLAEYERRLMRTPQVERELNSLSRELNTATNRYWVMRDKQFGAEMGEQLETKSKGERFTLLEPANLPLIAYKPNRPAIMTLALLFAVVCAIGITQLATTMDDSLYGPASVVAVQGIPPVAEIPFIRNEEDIARARRLRLTAIAGAPAAIVVGALVIHFAIVPLDVLWFAAMRRIGM